MKKLKYKRRADGMWFVQGMIKVNGQAYPICEVCAPEQIANAIKNHLLYIYPDLKIKEVTY